MANFINGSLVFRVWRVDGSGEVLAKFRYMNDAKTFALAHVSTCDRTDDWFLLAICEHDCEVQTYLPPSMGSP